MKYLTTLFFILLISSGATPNANEFIGEWIAVYTNSWSGFGNGVGLIFNFKNDKEIIITSLASDKKKNLKYKIDRNNNSLLFQEKKSFELAGYFIKTSNDQFVFISPDSSKNIEFRRIYETNFKINRDEVLAVIKNSSWTSKRQSDSIRIDFREHHRWDDERQPFEAMFHYWDTMPSKEKETWKIFEYKGKLFLSNTYYQRLDVIHQIKEFDDNKIVWTETYDADKFADLKRTKELSINETEELIEMLCRDNWKSNHVDTTKSNEGGQIRKEETDILTFDNLKETIEFKFNSNKTYSAKLSGQEWKKGVWDVTKDGEYVILDDERYKTNWVQIKQIKDKLILTKLHKFKGGILGFELYLITIRLE